MSSYVQRHGPYAIRSLSNIHEPNALEQRVVTTLRSGWSVTVETKLYPATHLQVIPDVVRDVRRKLAARMGAQRERHRREVQVRCARLRGARQSGSRERRTRGLTSNRMLACPKMRSSTPDALLR